MSDDWRTRDTGSYGYLKYILMWPNPIFEPVEIPECFRASR